jgi:hypothetical protein
MLLEYCVMLWYLHVKAVIIVRGARCVVRVQKSAVISHSTFPDGAFFSSVIVLWCSKLFERYSGLLYNLTILQSSNTALLRC